MIFGCPEEDRLVAITSCEEVFLWHTALLEDYTLHIDDTTKQLLILLTRIVVEIPISIYLSQLA